MLFSPNQPDESLIHLSKIFLIWPLEWQQEIRAGEKWTYCKWNQTSSSKIHLFSWWPYYFQNKNAPHWCTQMITEVSPYSPNNHQTLMIASTINYINSILWLVLNHWKHKNKTSFVRRLVCSYSENSIDYSM